MSFRSTRWLVALSVAACGVAGEQVGGPGDEVVRTRVYLRGDGEPIVKTETITREEFEAELAAREARAAGEPGVEREAIAMDAGCGGASLWIYDNTNHSPGAWPQNNEICFFKNGASGCADLRRYYRFCGLGSPSSCVPWATNDESSVLSFWAGVDTGYFFGVYGDARGVTRFGVFELEDDAQNVNVAGGDPFWVRHAQYVCF